MSVVLPSSSNVSRPQMNETHLREPRPSVYSTAHWLEFIVCRALDTHYMMRPVLSRFFIYRIFMHSLFDAIFVSLTLCKEQIDDGMTAGIGKV